MTAASKLLGTDWEVDGYLAPGISEGTWKRFLGGKAAINAAAFKAYCQVLNLDWQTIVEPESGAQKVNDSRPAVAAPAGPAVANGNLQHDWGNAPDVSVFYGRQLERETLYTWITADRCRLITLLGMGGIGKTAVAVKLARETVDVPTDSVTPTTWETSSFQKVFWRSLRNAPALADLLIELIQFLSNQQETELPADLDGQLLRLLAHLQEQRCLVILDNAESILRSGDRTGNYRPGYEGYGALFRCFAETLHQSCLIITAREKPKGLSAFEGATLPVRSLALKGLPELEGRALFGVKGKFQATEAEWHTLIERYAGNPLALKIVASSIHDFFGGDIAQFLALSQQGGFLFDDIRDLLDQHFHRLTDLEKSVMYWLAINREPADLAALQADLLAHIPLYDLCESINSLQRRSLIERHAAGVTQQPVVMEYVTNQLIDSICREIVQQAPHLLITHALVKAQAQDYIRGTQVTLILQPIVDQLTNQLGSPVAIATALQTLLAALRGRPPQVTGYAGGNSLNLLLQLPVDISGYDFSHLTMWQAYLQDMKLHNVNFAGADLSHCVFTELLGNVLSVAFSPDGRQLATGDTDCQVRVWDTDTGQLLQICRGHANWVRFVTFSPDGQLLASGGADHTVRLWQAESGVGVKTLSGHSHEVFAVAFSPDGQLLASASGDGTVKLWEVRHGTCCQTLRGHQDWVRSLAFLPSSDLAQNRIPSWQLVSGGIDGCIKLWDTATGNCLQTFIGHTGDIRSLAVSPDGQILASGSGDGTLKLWDCCTWECLATYSGHSGGVYCVVFSPTHDWLISSSGDRTVKLWDWHTDICLKTLHGHFNEVCSVAVHPDGQRLACVSLDQKVKLWDISSGRCLHTWEGHTDWALPVAFSPDNRYLASGSNDKTIMIWDWHTGQPVLNLNGHKDFVYSVVFSPDSRLLASGSTDCTARLWDLQTGQCRQILQGHQDWINAIAIHPQGHQLATASADTTVKLWNLHTGQCLHTLAQHNAKLLGVAFSPTGEYLASCGSDQRIQLWDSTTGEPGITLTGHTSRVWSVAFSPDGKTLASSSTDQTVKLWCLNTATCLKTFEGHTNWVFAVAFSPDGQYLASASHDHTLRLWEVATGKCLQVCRGHWHLVSSLAYSADGQAIATGSQDQTVRIWNTATGECNRVLIAKRLYEGMNLTEAIGLTPATLTTLQMLGAIVNDAAPSELSGSDRAIATDLAD